MDNYKSGFISIIGRSNVGKSTFLNHVIGKKVAITSSKPQTTRNNILGILTTDEYQMVFTDTPGIHKPKYELDNRMTQASYESIKGVDAIIFMTTPLHEMLHGDELILNNIRGTNIPVYLVINKIDTYTNNKMIDETILIYTKFFDFKGVFPISALNGTNVLRLLSELEDLIPLGPKFYPDEMISDHPERFLISEIIREKILLLTNEEVPHSIAVVVESMKPSTDNENYTDIYATIFVERDSQKKIVIGKNGELIKSIKEKSIGEIKKLLQRKVHLELWVKVKKDWRDRPSDLKALGYGNDNY